MSARLYGKYQPTGQTLNAHAVYASSFEIPSGLPSPLCLAYGPGSGEQGSWWVCDAKGLPSATRAGGFMRSTNRPGRAEQIEGFDKESVKVIVGGNDPPEVDYVIARRTCNPRLLLPCGPN